MSIFTDDIIAKAAAQFNTPLYLYDHDAIQNNYRLLRKLVPPQMDIFYSMKANPLLGICQILQREKACCEICSEAELFIALKAGFAPHNIIFVGPGKSVKELELCVKYQLYAVACESLHELMMLDAIAARYQYKCPVLLRINPHFTVHNAPLKMGGKATQFGMDLAFLREHITQILACNNLIVRGIHIYNGTRILDAETVIANTVQILDLAEELATHWRIPFDCIDIGGGLGIPYFKGETAIDIARVFAGLTPRLTAYLAKHPQTRFILECGRYLIGKFGVLISKVISMKKSHDEIFVVTDAGMNCHLAATGIGSFVRRNFPIHLISIHATPNEQKSVYNITGPLCTPGDVLATQVELPQVYADDLIVVENSGAYGSTASPGRFLSHGFPAEAVYHAGQFHLLKRRETVEDVLTTFIPLPISA